MQKNLKRSLEWNYVWSNKTQRNTKKNQIRQCLFCNIETYLPTWQIQEQNCCFQPNKFRLCSDVCFGLENDSNNLTDADDCGSCYSKTR